MIASSPTSPLTGAPSVSSTSAAMPRAGPPTETGLSPWSRLTLSMHAPISVPPEMLTIGTLSPPISENSHHHGSGFQGSPVEPNAFSEERSWRVMASDP